jgi:hypothetical protein
MPKKAAAVQIVKEENEIQSYINSFKEMEEPDESKVYIEETEIGSGEAIEEG